MHFRDQHRRDYDSEKLIVEIIPNIIPSSSPPIYYVTNLSSRWTPEPPLEIKDERSDGHWLLALHAWMVKCDDFTPAWNVRLSLTVKVACVVLRLQLRDELCLLSQQTVPVQTMKKLMVLDLVCTSCITTHSQDSALHCVLNMHEMIKHGINNSFWILISLHVSVV